MREFLQNLRGGMGPRARADFWPRGVRVGQTATVLPASNTVDVTLEQTVNNCDIVSQAFALKKPQSGRKLAGSIGHGPDPAWE